MENPHVSRMFYFRTMRSFHEVRSFHVNHAPVGGTRGVEGTRGAPAGGHRIGVAGAVALARLPPAAGESHLAAGDA